MHWGNKIWIRKPTSHNVYKMQSSELYTNWKSAWEEYMGYQF